MKRIALILVGFVAVMFSSCTESSEDISTNGKGELKITPHLNADTNERELSRQAEIDVNEFSLLINDASGLEVKSFAKLSDSPSQVELNVGEYQAVISSGEFTTPVFEMPQYKGVKDFTIIEEQVTPVEVACTQANVAVKVAYAESFKNKVTDYSAKVIYAKGEADEASLAYVKDEARLGYFMAGGELLVEVMADGKIIGTSSSYVGVAQDELTFMVKEVVTPSEAGKLEITITLVKTNKKTIDLEVDLDADPVDPVDPVVGAVTEDFETSALSATYSDGSFVGVNNIEWTYVKSRDVPSNVAELEGKISGKAIMLRRVADESRITSGTITGGVKTISVKLYKGFTGGGDRQVELFVNGVSKGVSEAFDDYNEHVFTVDNINVAGDFTIEFRNISTKQIYLDDISWSSMTASE